MSGEAAVEHAAAVEAPRQREVEANGGSAGGAGTGHPLSPHAQALLHLQRAAGNGGVAQLLGGPPRRRPVQRAPDPPVPPAPSAPSAPSALDDAIKAKDADALKAFRPFPPLDPQKLWDICDTVLANWWVGPDDERTLEEAWKAYRPPTLTEADFRYWQKCDEAGAEARNVPWLAELRTGFAQKTRERALHNMEKNTEYIKKEAKRLGLGVDGEAAAPTSQENDEIIAKQREAAFQIKDARDKLKQLTELKVGWRQKAEFGPNESRPGGTDSTLELAPFVPGKPPLKPPGPDDKMASYDTVMAVHTAINEQINTLLNANPALYALMATDVASGGTDSLVGLDVAGVKVKLTNALTTVLQNVRKSTAAINDGELKFQDLQPVHQRIYETDPTYKKPFEQAVAKDYVADEGGNAENASTLMTVAVMALIAAVEIGTAGTATPVIAAIISLTASAATAADSWNEWSKLEMAGQSTVSDETAIVSREQVDAASLKATIDTAMALLDVFLLGKATRAASSLAKVAALEKKVAEKVALRTLASMDPAERVVALSRAIERRGIAGAVRESGQTVEKLIELVGKESELGKRLAQFAAVGAKGVEDVMGKLSVLKSLAREEAAKVVGEAVDLLSPAEVVRRTGGWGELAAILGQEAPAMKRLDNWRGLLAREAEAAVASAGDLAPNLVKDTARSVMGQRSGLANDLVEQLLGLEITMLGDWLSQGEGGFQVGTVGRQVDLSNITREEAAAPVAQRSNGSTMSREQKALAGYSGSTFELIGSEGLRAGAFVDHGVPRFDFLVAGQYNASGWGIDRIGFVMDGRNLRVYQIEMKYIDVGSLHVPQLGITEHGTQTGLEWTTNAARQLLNSSDKVAVAARTEIEAGLRALGLTADAATMERILLKRLPKAQVILLTTFYAPLHVLQAQVRGLISHGRSMIIVPARPRFGPRGGRIP